MAKKVDAGDFVKCADCGIEIKKKNELRHKFKNHQDMMQKKSEDEVFGDLPDRDIKSDFNVDDFLAKKIEDEKTETDNKD